MTERLDFPAWNSTVKKEEFLKTNKPNGKNACHAHVKKQDPSERDITEDPLPSNYNIEENIERVKKQLDEINNMNKKDIKPSEPQFGLQ